MNEFKIKPKKEIKNLFILRFVYCFLCIFAPLFIIFFASFISGKNLFPFKNFIVFTLCAIPLSFIYPFIVEKLGSGLGDILLGAVSNRTNLREQLSADLAKARFSKAKGQFKEALIVINEVIEKDPEFPDALLLKAQILWEGFENRELAIRNLDKVMQLTQDDDPIHRWAVNYYHEIIKDHRFEK